MILLGASGKDAEIPINLFDATTQAPITGHTWIAGELKVALPGGIFTNADETRIVEKGRGRYAYRLLASETGTTGAVVIDLDTTNGYLPHAYTESIVDVGTAARDSLLNYSFRTGRTVRGFFRRVDAFATNKASGLIGALVTFFQPDGATAEFSVSQDTVVGSRGAPDVTNSETP